MICIIALIVFAILGIFSARYRIIAKEAFNCVFKKITLRKCDTGLDVRLKSEITGKFLRFNHNLGKIVYKYFEVFSWIFLILTIATLFFTFRGLYNYAAYGNCNGPDSNQFCIFDPLGTNTPQDGASEICAIPAQHENKPLNAPPIGEHEFKDNYYKGSTDAKVVIIEFGCYSCHYTKIAEPTIKKIIEEYDGKILYIYRDFPLSPQHITALKASEAAHCALDQRKYWEYREYLFANQQKQLDEDLVEYAGVLGLDTVAFKECLDSGKYRPIVEQNYNEGLDSGITVTPTFFVNDQAIIGAKDYSEFRKVIDKELGINWWEFWK